MGAPSLGGRRRRGAVTSAAELGRGAHAPVGKIEARTRAVVSTCMLHRSVAELTHR